MRRRFRITWGVIAILMMAVVASSLIQTSEHGPAPEVSFVTLSGQRESLGSLRGHPVLVTFWATSCPYCVDDMTHLIHLHENFAANGLRIIAVAMPYDPPNRVLEMARKRSIPYTVALDVHGHVLGAFGDVPGTPTTFLIGPDGNIAWRTTGPLDPVRLTERIRDMIDTARSAAGTGMARPGII